ncbi:MAG: hypothetical protein LQ338_001413 [Usnochroma carphineum]|nr:MAG: hypothetical protein LQ338_001413 [Usnochroma carphineum]
MLAARDQENLVHGHQAAAAAKPLNQGIKQLPPRTPGNKTAKPPLKLPLNDENGPIAFGGGKKTLGKGNENAIFGDKQGGAAEGKTFVTPMGPRNRAPLGVKTTNAKAKAFQTPAPASIGGGLGKPNQKSVSIQKPKPKVSCPETTKLEDILADKEALDEREIEYMPPKPKDLPDFPDDYLPELNPPLLHGPNVLAGWFEHFANERAPGGLSYIQRKEIEEKETNEYLDQKGEAEIQFAIDSTPMSCLCDVECWGDECKRSVARRKEAQETYKKTMAALQSKYLKKSTKIPERKGPSLSTSKAAATALSNPKRPTAASTKPAVKPSGPAKKPISRLPLGKRTPAPLNPSERRHAVASAASKTTMGYSKGRATSAAMRKTVLPGKGNQEPEIVPNYDLPPALFIKTYGVPRYGTHKWLECQIAGCFDENNDLNDELGETVTAEDDAVAKYFQEEAEKEFVLEI